MVECIFEMAQTGMMSSISVSITTLEKHSGARTRNGRTKDPSACRAGHMEVTFGRPRS